MTATQSKTNINLKGSVDIVAEYFDYAVNNILYQRGLYPSEDFKRVEKYGIGLLMTANEKLRNYLTDILGQVKDMLMKKKIQRIVLLIVDTTNKENLERWDFVIDCHDEGKLQGSSKSKTISEINAEIRAVMRQITASITFLPLLDGGACAFDIVLYTNKDTMVSEKWKDAAPCTIDNAQVVRLKSFSTGHHTTETVVSYRNK